MENNTRKWLLGLQAAVYTGLINTASLVFADQAFSIFDDYTSLWKAVATGTIVSLLAYLKQSPLPYYTFEGGDTKAPVDQSPKQPSALLIPSFAVMLGFSMLGLTACSTTPSTQITAKARILLPVVRPASSLALSQYLGSQISQTRRVEIAKQAYVMAVALRTISKGQVLIPGAIEPSLRSVIAGPSSTQAQRDVQDQLILLVTSVYAAYYPQFAHNGELALQAIEQMALGLDDAAGIHIVGR